MVITKTRTLPKIVIRKTHHLISLGNAKCKDDKTTTTKRTRAKEPMIIFLSKWRVCFFMF